MSTNFLIALGLLARSPAVSALGTKKGVGQAAQVLCDDLSSPDGSSSISWFYGAQCDTRSKRNRMRLVKGARGLGCLCFPPMLRGTKKDVSTRT